MKIRRVQDTQKIELQIVPMIDIVFQLLVFFIMTFKIVAQEGDFNVKMPLAAPNNTVPDLDALPPMKLRLVADGNGNLAGMQLGERGFAVDSSDPKASFAALRGHIFAMIGGDAPGTARESAELELDCDYDLRYENVIAAITAVTGHTTADGQVIKLIEKIKFAPPRQPG